MHTRNLRALINNPKPKVHSLYSFNVLFVNMYYRCTIAQSIYSLFFWISNGVQHFVAITFFSPSLQLEINTSERFYILLQKYVGPPIHWDLIINGRLAFHVHFKKEWKMEEGGCQFLAKSYDTINSFSSCSTDQTLTNSKLTKLNPGLTFWFTSGLPRVY